MKKRKAKVKIWRNPQGSEVGFVPADPGHPKVALGDLADLLWSGRIRLSGSPPQPEARHNMNKQISPLQTLTKISSEPSKKHQSKLTKTKQQFL
ncbi:hypothetical protein BUE80_DR009236 [Diplocarpon rosae]|nr:hypothetical protein BUE80_DR009236 [Diplocarpon rosae]